MFELDEIVMPKYLILKGILAEMGSVLVAFSGGVDSTLLLKVAWDVLGGKAVAATARSGIRPSGEFDAGRAVVESIGVKQLLLTTDELQNPKFVQNPPEKCYYCKRELFARLTDLARENQLAYVADGSNVDDDGDFRPGERAARELGIRSPLREAGFTKADIRKLSKALGLPNWGKPAMACLASRFPYGTPITAGGLRQVDEAEKFLKGLGFTQLRVRHHGDIARIEVLPADMGRLLETARETAAALKDLGYSYITLDLMGYRTGSMNEKLTEDDRKSASGERTSSHGFTGV